MLVAERAANGGLQLPPGRLDDIAAAAGVSRRELQHRMRLAEAYTDEAQVRTAYALFGSWTAIRQSLSRPRHVEAQCPGQLVMAHESWVESGAALQQNRVEHAARRADHDADLAAYGPNPTVSRPLSTEAERLRDALRRMAAGAKEVQALMALEPLLTLEMLIRELPPRAVVRQLREVRAAHDAVVAAFRPQQPVRRPPRPASAVIEMEVLDPDADIDGVAWPLPLPRGQAGAE